MASTLNLHCNEKEGFKMQERYVVIYLEDKVTNLRGYYFAPEDLVDVGYRLEVQLWVKPKLPKQACLREMIEIEICRHAGRKELGGGGSLIAILIDFGPRGMHLMKGYQSDQAVANAQSRYIGRDEVQAMPIILVNPPPGDYGDAIVVNTTEELEAALSKILTDPELG